MFSRPSLRTAADAARGRALTVRAAVLVALTVASAGCGKPVDVKQTFVVTELSGGWFDAGVQNGKNRLLPSVTFRIEKKTDEAVRPVAINVLFKRLIGGSEEQFEDVFLQRVEFSEGNRTAPLTVRPEAGYSGEAPQSRADMLQNSQFVDVRAVIFAKQSSSTWVELGRMDLPRTLLTR